MRYQTDTKGQVAFEFVILVAILFSAMLVFTLFVSENFSEVQSDTDYFKMKDIALTVKSEINLAAALDDGYQRSFFVPLTIDGLEYNISTESTSLLFTSSGAEYVVAVPSYSGTVKKGNNVIQKIDGNIEINT
ncbi:MAG: hypothetical protein V1729_02175 [Candidatus Woesearchaeota archaeon]